MEIDKTTLNDLAVFNTEEEFSIFNYINQTLTSNGKEQLRRNLSTTLNSIEAIFINSKELYLHYVNEKG